MIVSASQETTSYFPSTTYTNTSGSQLVGSLQINSTIVAQTISDSDLLGDFQRAYSNFIDSGQVWALLIGLVLGYMIRSLTSYG